MFCIECGSKLPENAKFCMECGTKVPAPPAPEAEISSCLPGKKYEVFRTYAENDADQDKYGDFAESDIAENDFFCGYYTRLEDQSAVGWVYGHINKFADRPDDGCNLYRVEKSGSAQYLGAGSKDGIETMYVLDGWVYWRSAESWYKTGIYDDSPAIAAE